MRFFLALFLGKVVIRALQFFGRSGGTALPGLVANRLAPDFLARLSSKLPRGSILITGTNGKTTTSRMLSTILETAGIEALHNRMGSNLLRGLSSTLLHRASLRGEVEAELGLWEVDEGVFPLAAQEVKAKVVVLLNLFRDQLDRYTEIAKVERLWRDALKSLPAETALLLNGDDPILAELGKRERERGRRVLFFGIEDLSQGQEALPRIAEVRNCPSCGSPLLYKTVFIAHQGKYECPQCGDIQPILDSKCSEILAKALDGANMEMEIQGVRFELHLPLPGLYNVYNALAAASVASLLGIPPEVIQSSLEGFKSAFGRAEEVMIGGKKAVLLLVKNPAGFNEVLKAIVGQDGALSLLIIINDLTADGKDISWLWDVDFEILRGQAKSITVSGLRAEDMALRLKYAALSPGTVLLEKDIRRAILRSLRGIDGEESLYILPTYTALLETHKILHKMGYISASWED